MKSMMISEFKAKAISTLKQVKNTQMPLTITLRGKPLALIMPPDPVIPKKVLFDTGKGLIDDPMSLEDWENNDMDGDWEDHT